MSSKMRIMKKMMSSDQTTASKPRRSISQQQEKNSSKILPGGIVRVCSDCNTTKTPLWRSGPQGPKSLCNACGIRQRKARRSMSTLLSATNSSAARDDPTVPFKKRCRFISTGVSTQRKLCFEDVAASLKRARVFPQDEKDAAILLMALSCGLMCS
ncbi:hypothetical protein HPP92_021754 [Vanilla planifolia]|nr:hypothetical protein HPP92_021754 [Vanilla planifolia]